MWGRLPSARRLAMAAAPCDARRVERAGLGDGEAPDVASVSPHGRVAASDASGKTPSFYDLHCGFDASGLDPLAVHSWWTIGLDKR